VPHAAARPSTGGVAGVLRERRGAGKSVRASSNRPSFFQQVSSYARQQMIAAQSGIADQGIDILEPIAT